MQKYKPADDLQTGVEIENIPTYKVDLHYDANPVGTVPEWQDEKNVEELYINVYIPSESKSGYWGYTVDDAHPDVVEWLNEQVGTRRAYGLEWYQSLSQDAYDWSIRGMVDWHNCPCVQIMVKNKAKALLLKLTFGGL